MARARLLSLLLERARAGEGEFALFGHGFFAATQISHCHGSGMESLGSGNLPRPVGQSADSRSYRKSWQRKASIESALRAAHVKDLFYLSLSLYRVDDGCSFPVDAADRRGGVAHGFDSWGRDFIPKIPSRARALPCPGISSA